MLFNSRVLFYIIRVLISFLLFFHFFVILSYSFFVLLLMWASENYLTGFFLCLVVCGNRCIYGESNIGV